MTSKKLTLSLIIPAFNEERHIRATLESVARQTVMPDEVIVVDNNSTDSTASIAKEFDFVRVITEKEQGLTYSRNTGFSKAKSDILGRVDADSILEEQWVEKVINMFEDGSNTNGIAGMGNTPLIPYLSWPIGTFHTRAYFYNVHSYFKTTIMWGGNMAITKKSWDEVKFDVTNGDSYVHEDQDVTLCMVAKSLHIRKAYHIRVTSYDQSFRYLPKLMYYIKKRNKTAKLHKRKGNLPVSSSSLSATEIIGSHILELPALAYGLITSIITFPIDYVALKVFKAKNWFD